MLNLDNAVLAIVDVQGKLAQLMTDKENLFANLQRMVKGAKVLGVPILWAEQNPAGLGPTIPEVATLLDGVTEPFSKMSFSCMGSPDFVAALEATGRRQVLLTGIRGPYLCLQYGRRPAERRLRGARYRGCGGLADRCQQGGGCAQDVYGRRYPEQYRDVPV